MTDAAEAEADEDASADRESLDPLDEELVARVAAEDETLAAAVGELQERVAELEERTEELETELEERADELEESLERADELEERLKRSQADFQNYKRRAKEREEGIRERATEDLVERLLDVRDNLVRALDQDANTDVRDGVEVTLNAFDRVLSEESVETIEPEPGAEPDPRRHQVVQGVESDRPEGTIVDVYRPGYEMAGTVLREAQVTVSEGPAGTDEG